MQILIIVDGGMVAKVYTAPGINLLTIVDLDSLEVTRQMHEPLHPDVIGDIAIGYYERMGYGSYTVRSLIAGEEGVKL